MVKNDIFVIKISKMSVYFRIYLKFLEIFKNKTLKLNSPKKLINLPMQLIQQKNNETYCYHNPLFFSY